MSARCHICAQPVAVGETWHARCLETLFGTRQLPRIDVDLARMHTLALAMVGRVSLSGLQRKLSVQLSADRATLQVAMGGGRYILKPQAQTFPHLPENEWLTQQFAALAGISTAPSALVPLADGSLAYITQRCDRLANGRKLAMEDFCQLSERLPVEKYESSSEQCAAIVRRHASEPLIEVVRLYRLLVFSWWVGNGDLHLKNLALLRGEGGQWRLSPAYDLLNTRLVLPDDPLALPACGKRDKLKTATWKQFAERIGITPKVAERTRAELAAALPAMLEVLLDAPLPDAMQKQYAALLRARAPA